jgi:hypothetical protein
MAAKAATWLPWDNMTLPLAELVMGGKLGNPSKMPGRSWGISAYECDTGNKLQHQEHAVCSPSVCYAKKGHYMCPSVKNAHKRRLAALDDPRWTEAAAYQINVLGERWMRWFDSGDLQSVEHLDMINWVAKRTRHTNHWLPTHEVDRVGEYLASNKLASNLVVRISAPFIEDRPFETHGLPTSTVHLHPNEPVPSASGLRKESLECKAYTRGHKCLTCRACWSPKAANISYLKETPGRRSKKLAVIK